MAGNPLDYLGVGPATVEVAGKVELATIAETTTGTNATKACTPAGVAAVAIAGSPDASEGTKGIAFLATTAEAQTGTNDTKIMTPLKSSQQFASPGAIGGTTPNSGAFTALSADGTGAVSLVSNAAALFDATGAGIDLTLSSDAGRVIINGEEAAANAITLLSAAGGIDANAALQINVATSQSANDAIVVEASAGGIDILASGAAAGEDIDIIATGSSVNITSTENAANAIVLTASAGGIDLSATGAAGEDIDIVNTGGSINLSATESIENAINIESTAGGINILASGAAAGEDIDIVATGSSVNVTSTEDVASAIYLRANGGTSETVKIHSDQGTGVASIDILSDVGGIALTSGLASEDAINLIASAGGIDMDAALSIVVTGSENAADAIQLTASAGGIDITAAGAAGEDLDLVCTSGSANLSGGEAIADAVVISAGAGGIDILAPGAGAGLDIDITNTGGSVNVTATESAADAVKIEATLGGIDILASGAAAGEDIDIVATGSSVNISSSESAVDSIKIESTAGGIDILASGAAAGEDIDMIATGSSVNITSTEAVAAAINLTASTGAGGITMTSGTGNITMTGTVNNLDAKYVKPTGIDYTFASNPVMQTAATTGGAATGATGDVNLMGFNEFTMEQFILGAGQTIISPRMGTAGLNIALDQVDNEGAEYNFGAARLNSPYAFTVNTDLAFQMICTFDVADVSGCEPLLMGFRKVEANNAAMTSYTDYAAIGIDNVAFAGVATISTELNSGGTTNTSTTDAWADGASHAIGVLVSSAGVVTYTFDGSAPSATAAFTFDSGDVVVPFIHFLNGSDVAGNVEITGMKIGFQ
tara:strand:+ start:498 stop:2993 length:2496 start_codon:yes stop_codon:yes gene_type:complete